MTDKVPHDGTLSNGELFDEGEINATGNCCTRWGLVATNLGQRRVRCVSVVLVVTLRFWPSNLHLKSSDAPVPVARGELHYERQFY